MKVTIEITDVTWVDNKTGEYTDLPSEFRVDFIIEDEDDIPIDDDGNEDYWTMAAEWLQDKGDSYDATVEDWDFDLVN